MQFCRLGCQWGELCSVSSGVYWGQFPSPGAGKDTKRIYDKHTSQGCTGCRSIFFYYLRGWGSAGTQRLSHPGAPQYILVFLKLKPACNLYILIHFIILSLPTRKTHSFHWRSLSPTPPSPARINRKSPVVGMIRESTMLS